MQELLYAALTCATHMDTHAKLVSIRSNKCWVTNRKKPEISPLAKEIKEFYKRKKVV